MAILDAVRDHPEPKDWTIGLLFVDREQRRCGVGSKLLNGFTAWARKQGAILLVLEVAAENRAAISFWRRHGFEQIGPGKAARHGAKESMMLTMIRGA